MDPLKARPLTTWQDQDALLRKGKRPERHLQRLHALWGIAAGNEPQIDTHQGRSRCGYAGPVCVDMFPHDVARSHAGEIVKGLGAWCV